MAITYPLTVPSLLATVTIRPRSIVAVSSSPFTGSQQVQAFQGEMWEASISFPVKSSVDRGSRQLQAFLAALRGPYGTFVLADPLKPEPFANVTAGAPVVDGAGQAGRELVTRGWTTSDVEVTCDSTDITCDSTDITCDAGAVALQAGDNIQLGDDTCPRLHVVLADAEIIDAGTGRAVLDIWPALRAAPLDGGTITTSEPKGLFRMKSGQTPGWSESTMIVSGIEFEAIEVLG